MKSTRKKNDLIAINKRSKVGRIHISILLVFVFSAVIFTAQIWQVKAGEDSFLLKGKSFHKTENATPDNFKQRNLTGGGNSSFVEDLRVIAPDGQTDSRYGRSVAISGNTAVVGDFGHRTNGIILRGAVFVYVKNGSTWTFQQKLLAPDGNGGIQLGGSVAISGDTIIAGAAWDNTFLSDGSHGAAYIFVREGNLWTMQQKLYPEDTSIRNRFGQSVSISGDRVIVGAHRLNSSRGAATVFVREGTIWRQEQVLLASDGISSDEFGYSVGISVDTAIVGALYKSNSGSIQSGSAYVYVRSGGTWSEQQKLTASDSLRFGKFGYSVGISGDTVIVGRSYLDEFTGQTDPGAAYIFQRTDSTWTEQQKLTAADGEDFDFFGRSVAISGDAAIIDASADDIGGNINQGSAYIFTRDGQNWTQKQKLTAHDGTEGDLLGSSVAISGNLAITGVPKDLYDFNNKQGTAYIFENVSNSGATPFDFDGDGKADISIYRPSTNQWWYSRSFKNEFRSFSFGSANDLIVPADFTGDDKTDISLFRPSTGEWLIWRSDGTTFYNFQFGTIGDIPAPGDFDGDGIDDPAVYRPSSSTWYILNSSTGETSIQQFGISEDIPKVADYDGDGKADIAIFRPSVSEWWISKSSGGISAFQFGSADDKPIPADYTGDGKADIAIWRPSNGNWFILRSEDNSYYAFPFGLSEDIPVPADYDGDGSADSAVFRPGDSIWYLQQSTNGFQAIQFGISGDIPIPSAYIP